MIGSSFDNVVASIQTREMQRDAYFRLGVCAFVVVWMLLAIMTNAYELPIPWFASASLALVIGSAVGILAYRRSVQITARAREEDRMAHEAETQKRIAKMQAARREDDTP